MCACGLVLAGPCSTSVIQEGKMLKSTKEYKLFSFGLVADSVFEELKTGFLEIRK